MSEQGDRALFAYMRWAKQQGEGIRYNLAQSGLTPPSEGLRLDSATLDLTQRSGDMPPEARAALAERFGVDPEQVMLTLGCSQALHLLCATHIRRGSTCFVESPVYEALPGLVRLFGGEVQTISRRFDDAYALPADLPERIRAARPSMVLLTNPHNPSGAHHELELLRPIAEATTEVGGLLVIDEVYLEFVQAVAERSACRLEGRVATVSSLTKAYGLGMLRFGWIVAPAAIIERAIHYNDYVSVVYPNPSAAFGLQALAQIDALSQRAVDVRERNVPIMRSWMETRDDISWHAPDIGIVGFPKIHQLNDTRDFCEGLARRYETLVVPGHFFAEPAHIRLGFGAPVDELEAGLEQLGRALDELRHARLE